MNAMENQVRQIVTMNPVRSSTYPKQRNELNRRSPPPTQPVNHGGTMLRVLGAARKREIKATQNLSIIVLFFMICWLPLYTINCIQAFCNTCDIHPKLTLLCIILTHLNSAVNPILYAYHLKDFRLALKNFVLGLLGFEVTQPLDIMHRYSMASQHRLPPRALSTRNISNRIYLGTIEYLLVNQYKYSRFVMQSVCFVLCRFTHLAEGTKREKYQNTSAVGRLWGWHSDTLSEYH